MYLSDVHLRERLEELRVECHHEKQPFAPDDQIQPCSIDLRLSDVFWEPKRGSTIDLRKSALLVLQPRRYYKRFVLRPDEYTTLKPGKMLIGCIYEKFSVPPDCAAKVEGRSSFGRLGLSVHCTSGFANPAYRGHFPLILVNHSPTPIRLFPFLPICQLMLIPLSSRPQREYGDSALQSKYMEDDGGPSYWWRDKRIRELQTVFQQRDISVELQHELLNRIGIQEPEIIERFERFFQKHPNIGGAQQTLRSFAESEDSKRKWSWIGKGFATALLALLTAAAGAVITMKPFTIWHYVIWAATLLCAGFVIPTYRTPAMQYYGVKEHECQQQ